MHVLVTGGTGFIGRRLCAELAARDHEVTALSRTPDEVPLHDAVSTHVGDVTAPDSIEGAFEGVDAVVNLVALSPLFKPSGGDERHLEVHYGGTQNIIAAAEEHDVEKLVQMSALGADPQGPTAYVRAKGLAEDSVTESSLDHTIVRPSVVFGEGGEFVSFTKTLTTPYVTLLPGGGKTRFQPIWAGDLVPMLADALDPEHDGETYELGGPEKLTMAEVARLGHRAEGRPVNVLPVPMSLSKIGLSVLDYVPGFPFGSDQYRSLEMDNTVDDNDVTVFGVDEDELTTLAAFLDLD